MSCFFCLFPFFCQSSTLLAESICSKTEVYIQNNSSYDCILTDYILINKTTPSSTILRNQSIKFDVTAHQAGKSPILRYQCGDESSLLFYFFKQFQSSGHAYSFEDRFVYSSKNLEVKIKMQDRKCNVITPGSPAKWFVTIENQSAS
ncbi:MAG: hypothetical protein CK426_00580 [Legionella sp.]|nr:MAG: hypothetical protein CK423_01870 [Legionella sp.]PJE00037.1 MAG: hypothetical protein CK426_00580 [Legionella sp.]